MITQREIYLDANATHPYLSEARARLAEALLSDDPSLANPSSIHRRGQKAKAMVARFRGLLCEFFGRPDGDEFVMCSGATEAINTALWAFARERSSKNRKAVFLSTRIEHKAVLDTLEALQIQGAFQVEFLEVDSAGQLQTPLVFEAVEKILQDPFCDVLCVFQIVNNEVGTAYNLPEIFSKLLESFGPKPQTKMPRIKGGRFPLSPQRVFACLDAAQALGKMPDSYIRNCMHYADYTAFSGHKIGAPTGMGILWLRNSAPFVPFMTGGTQERKRRAGTLNALGIFGFEEALKVWMKKGDVIRANFDRQRKIIADEILKIEGLVIHGRQSDGQLPALLNTLNFHVQGCPEESLLLSLDLDGFCLASGSACNSGSLKPSHVLLALGFNEEVGVSSIRMSLGAETTDVEVFSFIESLKEKVLQIKDAREKSRVLFEEEKVLEKEMSNDKMNEGLKI